MRAVLLGPHPLRAATLGADARAALAQAAAAVWNLSPDEIVAASTTGELPGLYLVASVPDPEDGEAEAQPRLIGFWLSFGPSYLAEGPLGPPDQSPPWVEPLLEVLIEEVWWSNLPYYSTRPREWRVPIVLEWTPALAARSELPPPGDPRPRPGRSESPPGGGARSSWQVTPEEVDDGDPWMGDFGGQRREDRLRTGLTTRPPAEVVRTPTVEAPAPMLPARRSLLCLVEARLTVSARLHRASYRVISPDALPKWPQPASWPSWLLQPAPADAPLGGPHRLGGPLGLPGERVGFALSGWLTRGLALWPTAPSAVRPGRTPDRVVQSRLRGQTAQASTLLLTVMATVMGVTAALRWIAEPRPRPSEAPAPPAPQPSLSPCSPDHARFVAELRCQIAAMAEERGGWRARPVCGDLSVSGAVASSSVGQGEQADLQSTFCGLLDREQEGTLAQLRQGDPPASWGDQVLAQACFNVLSHPSDYRLPNAIKEDAPLVADSALMLRDPALLIEPLPQLLGELRSACEQSRSRAERVVEGAIFAAHLGAPVALDEPEPRAVGADQAGSEAGALRRTLVAVAEREMSPADRGCFEQGIQGGFDHPTLGGLCTGKEDDSRSESAIWEVLGGVSSPAEPALVRYADARFARSGQLELIRPREPLWACHLTLSGAIPAPSIGSARLPWDLRLLRPQRYGAGVGAVVRQLDLDATLLGMEQGQDVGACWQVIRQTLSGYAPVHPLLTELDDEGWPSPEQQLCGQICAGVYHIRRRPPGWVTPRSDLDSCLYLGPTVRCAADPRAPEGRPGVCTDNDAPGAIPLLGEGVLDPLGLPWNGQLLQGWERPSVASICAYHLIAQGYFPEGEDGFVGAGATPRAWAGETVAGGNIAGSPDGLAADAIASMSQGNLHRGSAGSCGYVAAQCFTQALLAVTGDARRAPYQWQGLWVRELDRITRLPDTAPDADYRGELLSRDYPWCAPLRAVISDVVAKGPDERLESDGAATCRWGVSQVYRNVEGAIGTLVSGEEGGEKP